MLCSKKNVFVRVVYSFVALVMAWTSGVGDLLTVKTAHAADFSMPAPGAMVALSQVGDLPLIQGIKFDPANPFDLQFILERNGQTSISKEEQAKLVRYFFAGLTVAEENLWVNLSPYENDRIIDNNVEKTEIAETLLAQDYLLKQLSSSITHPDTDLGQKYWNNNNTTTDTFNKIWISPANLSIYDAQDTILITDLELKVETEADYLAAKTNTTSNSSTNAVKEFVVPALAKDVNTGSNFAPLRQMVNSVALAQLFKKKFRDSLYSFYYDSGMVKGIDQGDPSAKDMVFNKYVEAFNKGSYDTVKKVRNSNGRLVKQRYFSGGISSALSKLDPVKLSRDQVLRSMGGTKELIEVNTQFMKRYVDKRAAEDYSYNNEVSSAIGKLETELDYLQTTISELVQNSDNQQMNELLTSVSSALVADVQAIKDIADQKTFKNFARMTSTVTALGGVIAALRTSLMDFQTSVSIVLFTVAIFAGSELALFMKAPEAAQLANAKYQDLFMQFLKHLSKNDIESLRQLKQIIYLNYNSPWMHPGFIEGIDVQEMKYAGQTLSETEKDELQLFKAEFSKQKNSEGFWEAQFDAEEYAELAKLKEIISSPLAQSEEGKNAGSMRKRVADFAAAIIVLGLVFTNVWAITDFNKRLAEISSLDNEISTWELEDRVQEQKNNKSDLQQHVDSLIESHKRFTDSLVDSHIESLDARLEGLKQEIDSFKSAVDEFNERSDNELLKDFVNEVSSALVSEVQDLRDIAYQKNSMKWAYRMLIATEIIAMPTAMVLKLTEADGPVMQASIALSIVMACVTGVLAFAHMASEPQAIKDAQKKLRKVLMNYERFLTSGTIKSFAHIKQMTYLKSDNEITPIDLMGLNENIVKYSGEALNAEEKQELVEFRTALAEGKAKDEDFWKSQFSEFEYKQMNSLKEKIASASSAIGQAVQEVLDSIETTQTQAKERPSTAIAAISGIISISFGLMSLAHIRFGLSEMNSIVIGLSTFAMLGMLLSHGSVASTTNTKDFSKAKEKFEELFTTAIMGKLNSFSELKQVLYISSKFKGNETTTRIVDSLSADKIQYSGNDLSDKQKMDIIEFQVQALEEGVDNEDFWKDQFSATEYDAMKKLASSALVPKIQEVIDAISTVDNQTPTSVSIAVVSGAATIGLLLYNWALTDGIDQNNAIAMGLGAFAVLGEIFRRLFSASEESTVDYSESEELFDELFTDTLLGNVTSFEQLKQLMYISTQLKGDDATEKVIKSLNADKIQYSGKDLSEQEKMAIIEFQVQALEEGVDNENFWKDQFSAAEYEAINQFASSALDSGVKEILDVIESKGSNDIATAVLASVAAVVIVLAGYYVVSGHSFSGTYNYNTDGFSRWPYALFFIPFVKTLLFGSEENDGSDKNFDDKKVKAKFDQLFMKVLMGNAKSFDSFKQYLYIHTKINGINDTQSIVSNLDPNVIKYDGQELSAEQKQQLSQFQINIHRKDIDPENFWKGQLSAEVYEAINKFASSALGQKFNNLVANVQFNKKGIVTYISALIVLLTGAFGLKDGEQNDDSNLESRKTQQEVIDTLQSTLDSLKSSSSSLGENEVEDEKMGVNKFVLIFSAATLLAVSAMTALTIANDQANMQLYMQNMRKMNNQIQQQRNDAIENTDSSQATNGGINLDGLTGGVSVSSSTTAIKLSPAEIKNVVGLTFEIVGPSKVLPLSQILTPVMVR